MMTFIVGSIIWLFAVAMILYIIHTAIKPRGLIQKSDQFYSRHPNICSAVVICICAVVLYWAHRVDVQNDEAIRWEAMPHVFRGLT